MCVCVFVCVFVCVCISFFHIESGLSQKKFVDKGETFQQKTGRSLYKTHPNVIECHEMS